MHPPLQLTEFIRSLLVWLQGVTSQENVHCLSIPTNSHCCFFLSTGCSTNEMTDSYIYELVHKIKANPSVPFVVYTSLPAGQRYIMSKEEKQKNCNICHLQHPSAWQTLTCVATELSLYYNLSLLFLCTVCKPIAGVKCVKLCMLWRPIV